MTIVYSEEFKKEIRSAYPDWGKELDNLLDGNRDLLSRCLSDMSLERIEPEQILKAIDEGDVEELRRKAEELIAARRLYGKWLNMYQERQDKQDEQASEETN